MSVSVLYEMTSL